MKKRNKLWVPRIVTDYQNLERCKEFLAACKKLQATSYKLQAASLKLQATSSKHLTNLNKGLYRTYESKV